MPERLRLPFAALALIATVLLAYANSLAGEFVFDDQSSVVENTSIRSLWPPAAVLLPPAEAGICGRPFANLTMALNYALHGLDVRGYHVVNLALHVLSALILFGLVRRTLLLPPLAGRFATDATGIALAVAAIWALHPVQTNTVSYISQRVEGLMALCYLATLYCFLRYATSGSRRWAALAVISCVLGIASKEVMITAPVVLLLYDRTFLAGSIRSALRLRAYLHVLLASTWVFLGWLMLHAELAQRGIGFALGVSVFDYALSESRAVWTYLRLAVWPHPLVFDYGWAFLRRVTEAGPYLAVIVPLVLFSGFALWRRWASGFLGACFFIILSPSSSIAPIIQQPIAESRLYLPLAAAVALAVVGLYLLHRRTLWLWSAVALVFATLTSLRNEDYRTPRVLWAGTVAKRPENARAHNNLGSALLRAGQPATAADHFTTALQLQPTYPEPRQNLGVALLRLGRPADAVTAFEAALTLQPASASTLCNLGEALLALGRTAEAVERYESALRVDPGHAAAHNNLSVTSLAAGRFAEAREHAEAALRRQPDFAEAHYNLGNALVRAGQPAAAITAYTAALRLQPDLISARHNLGVAFRQSGRAADAATQFRAVLAVQPDHSGARRNLEQALQSSPR